MGDILRSFTYPRNAFATSEVQSAEKALATIDRARRQSLHTDAGGSVKDEAFNDSRAFLGTVARDSSGSPVVTDVGTLFEQYCEYDKFEAWRWLVHRSMWRFSVPNGTAQQVNEAAQRLGISFNFYRLIAGVLAVLSNQPENGATLYFDELLPKLEVDQNFGLQYHELAHMILEDRPGLLPTEQSRRALLGDLEDEYCVRDNMNTVFKKGFGQCGLFELIQVGPKLIGIRLSLDALEDPVLSERYRFTIDHPVQWSGGEEYEAEPGGNPNGG